MTSRRLRCVRVVIVAAVLLLIVFGGNPNDDSDNIFDLITTSRSSNEARQLGSNQTVTTMGQMSSATVPKLLHMTIADDPPAYMNATVQWTKTRMEEQGFDVTVWTDTDGERLIYDQYPDMVEQWERVKQAKHGRGARKADFLRVVLMHAFGGVYLDSDTVPCLGLDELVEKPGYLTFPLTNLIQNQVCSIAMSAPPGHPVFRLALNRWKTMGDHINHEGILSVTGPKFVTTVMDDYHASIGLAQEASNSSTGIPLFHTLAEKDIPEATTEDGWIDFESARVRMGNSPRPQHRGLNHLSFRTWLPEQKRLRSPCYGHPEMIAPFLDRMCGTYPNGMTIADCGAGIEQTEPTVVTVDTDT